jgi:hypothetical protein
MSWLLVPLIIFSLLQTGGRAVLFDLMNDGQIHPEQLFKDFLTREASLDSQVKKIQGAVEELFNIKIEGDGTEEVLYNMLTTSTKTLKENNYTEE